MINKMAAFRLLREKHAGLSDFSEPKAELKCSSGGRMEQYHFNVNISRQSGICLAG